MRKNAPGRTSEIILCGSRARGDVNPESDYDVIILVGEKSIELEDRIMEVAAHWLDQYDVFITPLICEENTFNKYQDAGLFRDISREGVRL